MRGCSSTRVSSWPEDTTSVATRRPSRSNGEPDQTEEAKRVLGVARMDDSPYMFALNRKRSCGIAKRRNVLRRTLVHGWFSIASPWGLAGALRSEPSSRLRRWRK